MGKSGPEAIIKREILNHLTQWEIDVWPIHTGGIPCRFSHGSPVWRKNEAKGMADIIGILPDGKFLAIEVKADTKQSPDQKAFQTIIDENNGLYILAHGPHDVREVLVIEGYL